MSRAALEALPSRVVHGGRNVTKARIRVAEFEGHPIAIKDFGGRPWPVRDLLGPWQLDREERAYARIDGIPGIPRLLGRIDRRALAIEYVAGPALAGLRPGDLPGSFFDALDALLESVHAVGVAHADLHRHDVLVGPGGRPYLVDFSTSIVAGAHPDPLVALIFRTACRADLRSAAKMRRRLTPGAPVTVPPRPWVYALGAFLRRLAPRGRRRPERW